MKTSIARISTLLFLSLICTSAAFASGTEKQIEKTAPPKAAGSVTERSTTVMESDEAVQAKNGSGTERDSTTEGSKIQGAPKDGSTSEKNHSAHQHGSGTERE